MKILTFKYSILKYLLKSTGNCFFIDINARDLPSYGYQMRKSKVNFVSIILFRYRSYAHLILIYNLKLRTNFIINYIFYSQMFKIHLFMRFNCRYISFIIDRWQNFLVDIIYEQ